jgi:hypothetical protein
MKKYYTVLSPIRFDGKDYAVGSQIDLEDAEAEGLHEGAIDGTAKEITPLIASALPLSWPQLPRWILAIPANG